MKDDLDPPSETQGKGSNPTDHGRSPGEPRADSIELAGIGGLLLMVSILGLLFGLLPQIYERLSWDMPAKYWLGLLGALCFGLVGLVMLCLAWMRRREDPEKPPRSPLPSSPGIMRLSSLRPAPRPIPPPSSVS